MIYVNPSSAAFQEIRNSRIYVDKTLLIAEINKVILTEEKFLCVSRPRRFGKSMAENMLAAYYSKGAGLAEDFEGLKIANDPSFDSWRGKVNVIKFDLNGFLKSSRSRTNLIREIEEEINDELRTAFPSIEIRREDSLAKAINKIHAATGELFAVIIDEYDVLFREDNITKTLQDEYVEFLASLFKNNDLRPAFAFAYLTGILPIVRERVQSKMNEFTEFSMLNARQLAEFVGFTAEEARALCVEHGMDYDECRRWYDGYKLNSAVDAYAPKSVVEAMKQKEYDSYWNATSSFEALKDYIILNFEGIKDDVARMVGGGRAGVNTLKYRNTFADIHCKDDVFTYLIHLGYLSYDRKTGECYIPNEEVRKEWVNSIEDSEDYRPLVEMIRDSKNLLQRTIEGDERYVAESLTKAHMRTTNPLTYNNEASFQSAIGLAYFYANTKYTVIKELPTGKGYADLALIPYVPNIPAMIIELKKSKSADSALAQIKERKYDDLLEHYRGDLLFVGINYDEQTKVHSCKIEKLVV